MTGPTIKKGVLTTAILDAARGQKVPLRQILSTLRPLGFNGHSIRTTVTTLVGTGALACDRNKSPALYQAQPEPAASIAQRVLQALRAHGEQRSCELITRFPDLEAYSIRNALMSLQADGRAARAGTRHQYRYYATGHQPKAALQLASVTGELLRDSAPAPAVVALAPRWPATTGRLGPPMIGWCGLQPVEVAA